MSDVHALVMAAGRAQRFGRNKLLEPIAGQPLLLRHLAVLTQVMELENIFLVLGHQAQQVLAVIETSPYRAIPHVVAEHYQQGLGHSIAAGVVRLEHISSALMITLADQWQLKVADYQRLLDGYLATKKQGISAVHCAYYQHHCGVPAVFPRQYFPHLKALTGDHGARAWLSTLPDLRPIALPNAAWDLDCPQDLNCDVSTIAQ